MTNIVIVIKDGLLDSVLSTDENIMVEKIDLDTQDPEELKILEDRLDELDNTYVDVY